MNRRDFLQATLAMPALALPHADAATAPSGTPIADRICVFTDHLDDSGYSWSEVAGMLRRLGVCGPDLTVRPGGLVAPDRVETDLPRAVAAFRDAGLRVPMISTGLTSARDPAAVPTLKTMGSLGIRYFKLGYYHYDDASKWQERVNAVRSDLRTLLPLAERAGAVAGLHNHAGATVGGALWDGWELLEPLDARRTGFYFDPAQATIEGGAHAWKLGFHRIASRLKMVAIKDFVWEKAAGGWRTRWCPLGEGMVRWPEFFAMLARTPFEGPISLHIEYDPGGATKSARFENSFIAAQKDLAFLRGALKAAPPQALAPAR